MQKGLIINPNGVRGDLNGSGFDCTADRIEELSRGEHLERAGGEHQRERLRLLTRIGNAVSGMELVRPTEIGRDRGDLQLQTIE